MHQTYAYLHFARHFTMLCTLVFCKCNVHYHFASAMLCTLPLCEEELQSHTLQIGVQSHTLQTAGRSNRAKPHVAATQRQLTNAKWRCAKAYPATRAGGRDRVSVGTCKICISLGVDFFTTEFINYLARSWIFANVDYKIPGNKCSTYPILYITRKFVYIKREEENHYER